MKSILDLSNYFYTFPAWPPLIVGACSLLLGLIIVVRERGSFVSRTFAALCSCVALWLLSIGILYSAKDPDLALGMARISTAAVAFIPSILLTFTTVIVRQYDRWKWLDRISLVLSGVMAVSVFHDDRVLTGLGAFPWGPYPRYSNLALVFVAFFVSLYVTSLVLLYRRTYSRHLLNTNQERDRQLSLALLAGFLASVDFLACFGRPVYPIGFLPVYTSLLILAQTIWKYRFAALTPAFAAPHIIRAMPSGLLVTDSDGQIVIANGKAAEFLGRPVSDLQNTTIQAILGDLFSPAEVLRLIDENGLKDYELVIGTPPGDHRVVSFSAALMRPEGAGPPAGFIFTIRDVTRRHDAEESREKAQGDLVRAYADLEDRVKQRTAALTEEIHRREIAEEALQTLAETDALTGLFNRRGFLDQAKKNIERAGQRGRACLILSADLDDLKPINDTYGHQTGDLVLGQTGDILRKTFREGDVIGRIGGDEFAVCVIEDADFTEDILRRRLRVALDALNAGHPTPYRVGISLGIARKEPHHAMDLEHLLAEADAALYEQKKHKPVLAKSPEPAPPADN